MITPIFDRFWKYVRKTKTCWIWTGAKSHGYGVLWDNKTKKYIKTHRFSYSMAIGPVKKGMFVCHRCDNPSCVRPTHLFVGSPKDNTHDSLKKKRWRGQRQTHCKRGHPLSGANLRKRTQGNGKRECKECARLGQIKWRKAHPGYNYAHVKKWREKQKRLVA